MSPELVSLRRAVEYGVQHDKKNVIAHLDPLVEAFTLIDALVAAIAALLTASQDSHEPLLPALNLAEAALKLAEGA